MLLINLSFAQNASWQLIGFAGQEVEQVVVDPIDDNIIYAGLWQEEDTTALYKSYNGGLTWQPLPIKNRRITSIAVDPIDHNNVYVGVMDTRALKSQDGGQNWQELPISAALGRFHYLSIDFSNSNIIYSNRGSDESVVTFRSIDYGETWQDITPEPTCGSFSVPVAIHPQDSDILYTKSCQQLFKSVDQGSNWNVILECDLNYILINPHCPDTVYAFDAYDFYASYDNGKTWREPVRMPYKAYQGLISPVDKNTIYAAGWTTVLQGNGGVLKTTDGGLHWELFNHGLPEANVWSVAISHDNLKIYASSDSGLYVYDFTTSVSERNSSLPPDFILLQNFPNPLSCGARTVLKQTGTTFTFQLYNEKPHDVILTIFDITGKKVRYIESGQKTAGRHQVSWDGRNENGHIVAPGIYIYQLKAGEQVQSKKMVIIR